MRLQLAPRAASLRLLSAAALLASSVAACGKREAAPVDAAAASVAAPSASPLGPALPPSAGARCDDARGTVCAKDGLAALRCDAGVLVEVSACLGPGGCAPGDAGHVRCDDSVAKEGAPCATEAQIACSEGGDFELACRRGSYVRARACKARCVSDEASVRCD